MRFIVALILALGGALQVRAAQSLEEASRKVDLARRQVAAEPANAALRTQLADALRTQAHALGRAERFRDSEAVLREVVPIRDALIAAAPNDVAARRNAGEARREVAGALVQLCMFPQAREALRAADDAVRRLLADFPNDAPSQRIAAELAVAHVACWKSMWRLRDAEAASDVAIRAWEALGEAASTSDRRAAIEMHSVRGELLMELGRRKEAEAVHRAGIALGRKLVAGHGEPENTLRLATSHNQLALLLREEGRWLEAESSYREALRLVGDIVHNHPEVPLYRREQARFQRNLAVLLGTAGRADESASAARRAERFDRMVPVNGDSEPERAPASIEAAFQVAPISGKIGERGAADSVKQLEIARRQLADAPAVPLLRSRVLIWLLINVATRVEAGQLLDAEEAAREAMQIGEKLTAEFPDVPAFHANLADALSSLNICLLVQGKYAQSAEASARIDKIFEKLIADYPDCAKFADLHSQTRVRAVLALQQLGKLDESEALARKALTNLQRLAERFPGAAQYQRQVAANPRAEGMLLRATGRRDEADARFAEAIERLGAVVRTWPDVPDFRRELASTYLARGANFNEAGKPDEAIAAVGEAVKIDAKLVAEYPKHLPFAEWYAKSCYLMATMYEARSDHAKAHEWYSASITVLEKNLAAAPERRADRETLCLALRQRGLSANRLQRFQDYDRDWQRAAELAERLDLISVRLARAARSASAGQLAKAFAEAEFILSNEDPVGSEWHDLAAVFAVCASATNGEGRELQLRNAIAALRQASAEGHTDPERLKTDRRFDVLRQRPEFIQLTAGAKR